MEAIRTNGAASANLHSLTGRKKALFLVLLIISVATLIAVICILAGVEAMAPLTGLLLWIGSALWALLGGRIAWLKSQGRRTTNGSGIIVAVSLVLTPFLGSHPLLPESLVTLAAFTTAATCLIAALMMIGLLLDIGLD